MVVRRHKHFGNEHEKSLQFIIIIIIIYIQIKFSLIVTSVHYY